MHYRPRRLRRLVSVAALDLRDRLVHGRGIRDRVLRAPSDRIVRASMYTAASFAAGFVFGLGLLVSGMANPAKVLAFLDLAGAWDPSLALVMAGAVAVGGGAFAYMTRRKRTMLGTQEPLPSRRSIVTRLVLGRLV